MKRSQLVSRVMHFARIKLSGIGITNISGKIAGTVMNLSSSAGVPTARVWAKPRNARTALQQFVKAVLSGTSSSFRTLTADQIAAWNQNANPENPNSLRKNVFGDVKSMSGSQLFQRINNYLLQLALPTVADPPGSVANDSITVLDATAAAGAATFVINPTLFSAGVVLPADTYMQVSATPQVSRGRSFFSPSLYRLIGFFSPGDSVVNMDIKTMYTDLFGALVEGQKISVQVHLITTDGTTTFGKTGDVAVTTVVAA